MHEPAEGGRSLVSSRTMEIVVALIFMALAVVIMADNWRIGATWGADGPGAGYFPFRVGLVMFVASAVTLGLALRGEADRSFVDSEQFRLVLRVLVPTIVFVGAIAILGIYVAAAIFIAFFMRWLGKYPLKTIVPVAIGVPAVLFMMFEVWFLVPLPKGPIETAFGY